MYNFVILCGGSGSRLWPKSREKLPKQFLKLTNENSMLQNTILRIMNFIKKTNDIKSKIIIICNIEHSHIVERQLYELDCNNFQIISEPKGRDSAPAICISALFGKPEDYTFILPCDHILDNNEIEKCINKALNKLDDSIITFGVKPSRIETGYGYIKIDDEFNTINFIEKPCYENAKKYFEDGTYLWNAGMFAFKNENMLLCYQKYASDIYINCIETIKKIDASNSNILLPSIPFVECRAISIDYAIMEKLCSDSSLNINKKTIPYNANWNDIGSYMALYDELDKNVDNNVIKGDVLTIDTNNCYIDSDHCITAVVGLKDIIIVNTDDALLICDKNKTQDVKKIVEKIKVLKREEAILHKTVFRPWGYYKNVEGNDNSGFKIKRISVYPGKRLSLQSHNFRSEHWVIVNGNAKVQVGFDTLILHKNQHVYIPSKMLHRIENIGEDLLEFTETQIGSYLGEDDIIRYEDDFGRI